jgi:hypothetical protein
MKNRHTILLAALAAASFTFWAGGAQGAAYKCQDEKGKVVFSDIPCGRKEPPPPKPEPKILPKVAPEPVALTKLTEPDVLRVLNLSEDYTRTNNHAEMCNLIGPDMKFRAEMQIVKPPRIFAGGKDEACQMARDNAEQSKKSGMVSLFERGPTKVTIEAGETRASAVYDVVVKLTRYDRIITTYRCSNKDNFVLVGGKAIYAGSDSTCKP